jgi:hypothetical protein
MGRDGLNRKLERLHREKTRDAGPRNKLEDDLLLRYRNIHPQKKRLLTMLNPTSRFARFAIAGLAMLLLGVGACTTETTTEVEVGKNVSISLDGTFEAADGSGSVLKSVDINQRIADLMAQFTSAHGVEGVNVNVEETPDGDMTLSLMLMGEGLDDEVISNMLRESFPELPDAKVLVEVVEGTITESWAERFGRQVFDMEIDGTTEEQIRAQVLRQVAEQGFEGDLEVMVTNQDGEQMIEIIMTDEEVVED